MLYYFTLIYFIVFYFISFYFILFYSGLVLLIYAGLQLSPLKPEILYEPWARLVLALLLFFN